ncbi:hypothetical protein JNUCC0626_39965 [Lentzea sp. JNUCC 0626]
MRLVWDEAGITWDWPGNGFDTIVMTAITDDTEPIVTKAKHSKGD